EAEHAQSDAASAVHVGRQLRARLARLSCSSLRLRTTIGRSHRFEPRPKRKSIQMTHRSGLETNAPGSAAPFPEVAEPVLRHVQTTIISWFSTSARELPWREPGTSAWAVLVSEIMSQQTPVARVEPRWRGDRKSPRLNSSPVSTSYAVFCFVCAPTPTTLPSRRPSDPAAPFPEVAEPVLRHVQTTIISWFSTSARELPWREPGTSAWAVLVSEIMSQQTPVARVEPRWR